MQPGQQMRTTSHKNVQIIRNDLHCVEWDIKLFDMIVVKKVHAIRDQWIHGDYHFVASKQQVVFLAVSKHEIESR